MLTPIFQQIQISIEDAANKDDLIPAARRSICSPGGTAADGLGHGEGLLNLPGA
jgi:hypothetical protein